MFDSIAYYTIFGQPLIFYTGALSLLLLFAAAYYGKMARSGKKMDIKYHVIVATAAILLAIIHALMAFA